MVTIKAICRYINKETNKFKPAIGIILGSGLGNIIDDLYKNKKEDTINMKYSDIPGFPVSTIKGHKGSLIFGETLKKNLIIMQGRFHYYEGYTAEEIVIPVRVMKELGVETLIVTNAAGAVKKDLSPGNLLLISDHINLTGVNPLRGANDDKTGTRFPDMSDCYDKKLRKDILKAAKIKKIRLKEGVYIYFSGPNYETKAEIKAARGLGADIVGMSTVPEVIAAVHSGMKVIGISCVTNMAAGILNRPLTHQEVLETTSSVKENFASLMKLVVKTI